MSQQILMIDPDAGLVALLEPYLGARGMTLRHQPDVESGLAELERRSYDALIVGVMPDPERVDVCRRVRARSGVPVILLTTRDELERVVDLEPGADDYLAKPFLPRELLARLKAMLRRRAEGGGAGAERLMRFGRLEIDRARREVRLDGTPRELTSHQFALLLVLAERPGQVQSRDELMEAVRGEPLDLYDRSIDVHISRIRAAIEDEPQKPKRIKTVRSAGYVFVPEQE